MKNAPKEGPRLCEQQLQVEAGSKPGFELGVGFTLWCGSAGA